MTYVGSSPRAKRIEVKVWRSLCVVTPLGSGCALCAVLGEQLVGPRDDRVDDARADIVLVPTGTACRREHEVLARETGRGCAVLRELVLQDGQHVDDPFAGLGLGPADGDLPPNA
jgi:hypothetical protein